MLTFSSNHLRNIVKDANPGNATAASQVDSIDFLEFGHLEDSVKSDVEFLRESPLVLKESNITGWVYEVETGKVCDEPFCQSQFHIKGMYDIGQTNCLSQGLGFTGLSFVACCVKALYYVSGIITTSSAHSS